MAGEGIFIVDANVLIDYLEVDAPVLTLIADHVGPVHVPRRIFQEFKRQRLGDTDCVDLGITIITEEIDELLAAATAKGPLSFQERLVVILARSRGWTAITNDTSLWRTLDREKIPKRWGLEMMLDLVGAGHLKQDRAVAVAERIVGFNRRYAPQVLDEFKSKIAAIPKTARFRSAQKRIRQEL